MRDQSNDYHKNRAMLPANFPDKDDVDQRHLRGSAQRKQQRD
jgi:hypothetical protein